MNRFAIALAALACAVSTAAEARGWQCVTYARSISDFSIRGNAHTWWHQAEGRFERGNTPEVGAVLAFRSSRAMRMGHVGIVREVVSDRELILDHANWSRRGGVERNARAIDVSAAGDWSAVRVTYGDSMGTRVNPTYGFIYARGGEERAAPPVQFAQVQAQPQRAVLTLGEEVRALAVREAAF
jgi:hypothetical protein